MDTNTFGPAYDESNDAERVLTQLEVIRDVLLSAAECSRSIAHHVDGQAQDWRDSACEDGGWMTLRELAELTNYGEASISAQLRHLRKIRFGGYVVAKRHRGPASEGVWEYRIAGRTEQARLAPLFVGAAM